MVLYLRVIHNCFYTKKADNAKTLSAPIIINLKHLLLFRIFRYHNLVPLAMHIDDLHLRVSLHACIYTSVISYFVLSLNNDRLACITKDLTAENADC